jgi:hypothetical protein
MSEQADTRPAFASGERHDAIRGALEREPARGRARTRPRQIERRDVPAGAECGAEGPEEVGAAAEAVQAEQRRAVARFLEEDSGVAQLDEAAAGWSGVGGRRGLLHHPPRQPKTRR